MFVTAPPRLRLGNLRIEEVVVSVIVLVKRE
jgi:hypothetical protein